MNSEQKDRLLGEARARVSQVQEETGRQIAKNDLQLAKYNGSRDPVEQKLAAHFAARHDQLVQLAPSPFFVRCDVADESGSKKSLYFAKHQLIEESIFSWTSPASRLRFADIGAVEYIVSNDSSWTGTLDRKDQFLITNGKIAFMTSEAGEYSRTMVYQEQLSKRKAGFILPEIIERMERAQDDVVRADHRGSFLIAGPAGSGKTTLAFHRIAFLLQSPDTSSLFSQDNVIVFVQDESTRAYFGKLLPDLGLHHVQVTTFAAWAFERLNLTEYHFIRRPNGVDRSIDDFETVKLRALRAGSFNAASNKDPYITLRNLYSSHFSPENTALFADQVARREFDRIDITLLLALQYERNQGFTFEEEYFQQKKSFEIIRKKRTTPLQYTFMVLDEIQNYLPEQVTLLRSCIDPKTKAMLYVGDLGQRVLFGTLEKWADVGEDFTNDRKVVLDKVYRSSKQIMTYIKNVGFDVALPDELREGGEVIERCFDNAESQMDFVRGCINKLESDTQIGILAFSDSDLAPYRQLFESNTNIHVLTVHQSQGVEFDHVFLVGVNRELFDLSGDAASERAKIQRDLLYVALTRAMDGLTIVGESLLKDCIA